MTRLLVVMAVVVGAVWSVARNVKLRGWLGCALIDAGSHVLPEPAEHDTEFARAVADYSIKETARRRRYPTYDPRYMP